MRPDTERAHQICELLLLIMPYILNPSTQGFLPEWQEWIEGMKTDFDLQFCAKHVSESGSDIAAMANADRRSVIDMTLRLEDLIDGNFCIMQGVIFWQYIDQCLKGGWLAGWKRRRRVEQLRRALRLF